MNESTVEGISHRRTSGGDERSPLGGSTNRLVALSPFQISSSLKVRQSLITINCAPQRMPVSRPISSISACRQWDISSLRSSEQCLYGTKVEIPDPQRPDFWRVAYEVKGTVHLPSITTCAPEPDWSYPGIFTSRRKLSQHKFALASSTAPGIQFTSDDVSTSVTHGISERPRRPRKFRGRRKAGLIGSIER